MFKAEECYNIMRANENLIKPPIKSLFREEEYIFNDEFPDYHTLINWYTPELLNYAKKASLKMWLDNLNTTNTDMSGKVALF